MIIAVLVGLALRLSMFIVSKSLWGDEYYSTWASQQPLSAFLNLNHPPLYYLLIAGHSELAMKLLSIACGIGTIINSYFIGKKLFDKQVGIIAAFLVAISPYFLQNSFEIRAYSLIGFLASLSIALYFNRRLITALILCSIIPFVEHIGIFVSIPIFLSILMLDFIDIMEDRLGKSWYWYAIYPTFLLSSVPVACWSLLALHQTIHDENVADPTKWTIGQFEMVKKAGGALMHINIGYRYSMMTSYQIPFGHPWFWVLILGAIMGFCYFAIGFADCQHKAKWMVFVPLLLILYPTKFHARYLVAMVPLYYVFMANGISLSTTLPTRHELFRWPPKLPILPAIMLIESFYMLTLDTDVVHRDNFAAVNRLKAQYVGKTVVTETANIDDNITNSILLHDDMRMEPLKRKETIKKGNAMLLVYDK